jgi:DNA polymerase
LGFSEPATALEEVRSRIRACSLCALCRSRTNAVPGEGPAQAAVVFVGEGPGAEEDRQGRPFCGASGKLLTKVLADIGIGRESVFITSLVKCRPPGNRDPLPEEIAACRPYLAAQLRIIQPRVVCALGRHAARELIDDRIAISRDHGRQRRIDDVIYVPMYHPAAALHRAGIIGEIEQDMRALGAILTHVIPGRKR